MRERIVNILLGLLFGVFGAFMGLAGLSIIKTGAGDIQGPVETVAGLMFFFVGAWAFFLGTLGPAGKSLPIYPWIRYFMILPILTGFGLIPLLAGIENGDFLVALLGILPLLGTVWYAIAKFPGRRKKR